MPGKKQTVTNMGFKKLTYAEEKKRYEYLSKLFGEFRGLFDRAIRKQYMYPTNDLIDATIEFAIVHAWKLLDNRPDEFQLHDPALPRATPEGAANRKLLYNCAYTAARNMGKHVNGRFAVSRAQAEKAGSSKKLDEHHNQVKNNRSLGLRGLEVSAEDSGTMHEDFSRIGSRRMESLDGRYWKGDEYAHAMHVDLHGDLFASALDSSGDERIGEFENVAADVASYVVDDFDVLRTRAYLSHAVNHAEYRTRLRNVIAQSPVFADKWNGLTAKVQDIIVDYIELKGDLNPDSGREYNQRDIATKHGIEPSYVNRVLKQHLPEGAFFSQKD